MFQGYIRNTTHRGLIIEFNVLRWANNIGPIALSYGAHLINGTHEKIGCV